MTLVRVPSGKMVQVMQEVPEMVEVEVAFPMFRKMSAGEIPNWIACYESPTQCAVVFWCDGGYWGYADLDYSPNFDFDYAHTEEATVEEFLEAMTGAAQVETRKFQARIGELFDYIQRLQPSSKEF